MCLSVSQDQKVTIVLISTNVSELRQLGWALWFLKLLVLLDDRMNAVKNDALQLNHATVLVLFDTNYFGPTYLCIC